jgi:hypothetical protein
MRSGRRIAAYLMTFFVASTLELFFFLINAVFSNSRLEARYVYSLVISFV